MVEAREAGEYLLMKRGLYYRPENSGYTGVRDQAGRYHESDASPDSGVTAIHVSEAPLFSPACWQDVKVKHLLARISALEAGLRPFAEAGDQWKHKPGSWRGYEPASGKVEFWPVDLARFRRAKALLEGRE